MSVIKFIDKPMKKSANKKKHGVAKTKRGMKFLLEEDIMDENTKLRKNKYLNDKLPTLQEV